MKNKQFGKLIKILIIALIMGAVAMTISQNKVFANVTTTTAASSTTANGSIWDILKAGSSWIEAGQSQAPVGTSTDDFVNRFIGIGQVLVAVGVIVLLIVTAITGIKWITASPDKKALLKQQLIGLVVAAVVIFGAVGIWNLVQGIAKTVESDLNVAQTTMVVSVARNK